jgi:hypothetical protein
VKMQVDEIGMMHRVRPGKNGDRKLEAGAY